MAKPRRGDTLELAIEDLAFGGEGVGRADGYVVFVRGGLPGDRLRVRVVEAGGRFGRAVIDKGLVASPDRVDPPCPYFGRCGGCRLQHLAYSAQLAFKEKQVRDCLERLGGLGSFELRPILPAPEPYGYRNKMEFTIANEPPSIGLHAAERYDVVLDIERCLLQSEPMNALLDEFRRQVRERALAVYDPVTERGLLRFVMMREGRHTGEAMVNIVGAAPDVERLAPVADALRARVPSTASVVLNVNAKKASVAVGSEEHLLAGRDHIREALGPVTFQVSANSFFQTNTLQAERLFALVEEACELEGAETLLDLYAGTGAISLLLARRVCAVYGIELAAAAVADAIRNARANGIDNCTFLAGEVRHVLPDLLRQGVTASVVVADPLYVQYARFLGGARQGNFGESIRHGEPAFGLVVERMPATFQLAGAALFIALSLAIPAGILSAVRRNTILDYVSTVVALLGQSMPTFWLGIMLILLFSVQLNLLPSSGRGSFEHLILPAITLGLFTTARITRLTRSVMLEVLNQDYIRTARAKGVSDPPVVWKHALKNAAIPIGTYVGSELGTLLGGSVITETIFAWPGVGRLSVQAIYNRDYPVVQAAVFLLASTFVLVNLFVDVVYTYLDPRIRLS